MFSRITSAVSGMLSAALASSSHPVSQSATDFSTGFTPQSAFPGVFLGYRPHLHRKLGLCRVLDTSNFRYPTPSGSHPTHPHFEHIFEKINHPMTLTATGLNPVILYPVSLAFLALPKNPADSLRFWKSLLCLDTHSPALAVFFVFRHLHLEHMKLFEGRSHKCNMVKTTICLSAVHNKRILWNSTRKTQSHNKAKQNVFLLGRFQTSCFQWACQRNSLATGRTRT